MPDPENPQSSGSDNSGQEISIINPDGSFVENWSDRFPETDRPTLSRFKTFDDLITSHMSLRRMSSKDPDRLVEIPDEDSPDEVKAEFSRRRGVPEKAEDYKYKRSKELSDNIDIDNQKILAFAQIAKKHDLSDKQFNGVVNDYLALVDKDIAGFELVQQEEREKEFKEAETALKKELGNAYDERVARANALLRKYNGQEMIVELGLENNPQMTLFLDRIAEDMSEDRIKGLVSIGAPTPSQVEGKIAELKAHPAFMDKTHSQHEQVVSDLSELYKKRKPA